MHADVVREARRSRWSEDSSAEVTCFLLPPFLHTIMLLIPTISL